MSLCGQAKLALVDLLKTADKMNDLNFVVPKQNCEILYVYVYVMKTEQQT